MPKVWHLWLFTAIFRFHLPVGLLVLCLELLLSIARHAYSWTLLVLQESRNDCGLSHTRKKSWPYPFYLVFPRSYIKISLCLHKQSNAAEIRGKKDRKEDLGPSISFFFLQTHPQPFLFSAHLGLDCWWYPYCEFRKAFNQIGWVRVDAVPFSALRPPCKRASQWNRLQICWPASQICARTFALVSYLLSQAKNFLIFSGSGWTQNDYPFNQNHRILLPY